MKKFAVVAATIAVSILLLAAPAFAGSEVAPPTVKGVVVKAPVVKAPDGLAFTGAAISLWMVVAAAVLIGGLALLVIGRRRRAHSAE